MPEAPRDDPASNFAPWSKAKDLPRVFLREGEKQKGPRSQFRGPEPGQASGVQTLLGYIRKWGSRSQKEQQLGAGPAGKGLLCGVWKDD